MDATIDQRGERLAGRVFDLLLTDIVRGVFPPGTPMGELDLCRRLGVSRTPVREALIKLSEIGLVCIYPQRGTFVAPISVEAFRDAQFIREHLECALVGEAVRYIDSTSLGELNDLIDQQEQAAKAESGEAFYERDEEFHACIARISRRANVWQVIRQTKIQFDRVRRVTLRDITHIPLLVSQHREIVDGLAACDEARAVAAMRRHLREVFRRAELIFAEQEKLMQAPPQKRRRRSSARAGAASAE